MKENVLPCPRVGRRELPHPARRHDRGRGRARAAHDRRRADRGEGGRAQRSARPDRRVARRRSGLRAAGDGGGGGPSPASSRCRSWCWGAPTRATMRCVTPRLYRLSPFLFELGDLKRVHGTNERLAVANYAERHPLLPAPDRELRGRSAVLAVALERRVVGVEADELAQLREFEAAARASRRARARRARPASRAPRRRAASAGRRRCGSRAPRGARGGSTGVSPPSTMLASCGARIASQMRCISASLRGASTKTMSAPRSAKARAAPERLVEAERSRARRCGRGSRRPRPARARRPPRARAASASSRATTCLPRVWPQRLGASWSSIITHAKPARA